MFVPSRQEGRDLRSNDDRVLSWAGTEQFVIFSFFITPGNWLTFAKRRGNNVLILHALLEDSENIVFQL